MIYGQLFPIFFIDSPEILDCYVTNIPGSGSLPLQVVVDSGLKAAYGVQWIDTSGDWIGLFTGTAGNEVLKAIIGGGLVSATPVVIPHNSRVSLRSMTTSSISNGKITISFLGQGWNGSSS